MIEDLVTLREKFKEIVNMGWIESYRNCTSGIGYTFETLIGKKEDSLPIPDYGSIEIKTRYRNSKYPISLFNSTPDGDYKLPMHRLYDRFSFPQHGNLKYKIFRADVYANRYTRAGRNYQFKLIIDKENKKIKLIAYSKSTGVIDPKVSWSFETLKCKLETKLKYLALIKADIHYEYHKQYFKYYDITFYMLKNFDYFIDLIEDGTIKVVFNLSYYKSGIKDGMMKNHGSSFEIGENDLEKLFIKIC